MLASIGHAALALAPPSAERVWAIGDLHGDAGCAKHWVHRTGLVDGNYSDPASWTWTDPRSKLVFMGDYIDRGPQARAVLQFVNALIERFPTHVHALLGNHELNLLIDRAREPGGGRYHEYSYAAAHPAQYAAWLSEPDDPEERAAVLRLLHDALLIVYQKRLYDPSKGVLMTPDGPRSIVQFVLPASERPRVAQTLRGWQAAYMRGVSSQTALGSFVHRPLSTFLADTIFVHGGLAESLLAEELPATSTTPAIPLGSLAALEQLNVRWLNASAAHRASATSETVAEAAAAEAIALARSPLVELATEIVEYRGLHDSYAARYRDDHLSGGTSAGQVACDRVAAVLHRLNASRIAVGHTPEDHVRIRCGGRLLALDSTLSRTFRAHGNFYCDATTEKADPHTCPPRKEACEGEIVRLERSGPHAPWMLHIVESDQDAETEVGAVEEMKVEL